MSVTIDFVAFHDARDVCLLVLVEQGPWSGAIEDHLKALQDRLYGCLDAVLDGQVAERFPRAANMNVIVRVDCYGVPRDDVDEFIDRFSEGILDMPDYSPSSSPWVRAIEFEVNHDNIH
jgi:hypothetical protein